MVLYQATIRSRLTDRPDTRPWSNVWHVEAASPAAALLICNGIVNTYINMLKDYAEVYSQHVQFDHPLASPGASSDNIIPGLQAGDVTLMLPLFNTIRVALHDGFGRPNLKYFRFPLQEDEIASGVPTTAFLDDLATTFLSLIPAIGGVVSNRGHDYSDIVAVPLTQMRQQGWHRRTRAGFHRGWVPD
jgi:hypothetical protein